MDIETRHFHFFNDLKIFLHYFYQVYTIDDAYKWCLNSFDTAPLYTILRVLNASVVYFRQIVDSIDKEILTDKFYELMIQIMHKYID